MVWILWILTEVIGIILCIVYCSLIEKKGIKRLGATGKLFKYQ